MHPYKYMNFLNQNVFKLRCLGKFFFNDVPEKNIIWGKTSVGVGHLACMSQLCLHLQPVLEQHLLQAE